MGSVRQDVVDKLNHRSKRRDFYRLGQCSVALGDRKGLVRQKVAGPLDAQEPPVWLTGLPWGR